LSLWGGCIVVVPSEPNGDPGSASPSPITVTLINITEHDLDPELYVAPGPISSEAQLFSPVFKVTNFRARGLIEGVSNPGSEIQRAVLTFDCKNARYIATPGGVFGDDQSDPIGTGGPVILVNRRVDLGGDFDCGADIQIIYSTSGAGNAFEVTFCVDQGCG
jgi:hypothetical protein